MARKNGNYRRLLRIGFPLLLGWLTAWLFALMLLGQVAVSLHEEGQRRDLDKEMSLYGTMVYALSWMSADGRYNNELLLREPDFTSWPHSIWVLAPGKDGAPKVLMKPQQPRFNPTDFSGFLDVVLNDDVVWEHMMDAEGRPTRIYSAPLYGDRNDKPLGAIVVAANLSPTERANQRFSNRIKLVVLGLAVSGLIVGIVLTFLSVRPILQALRQRERFLTATAHELRTPIAALRGVCDSALAGDEGADTALSRIDHLLDETGQVVEQLLLLARLDAGQALEQSLTRIDLLVEALLPEDNSVKFSADPCTANVDVGLMQVAIRNLLSNAQRYGDAAAITVTVSGAAIEVQNGGSGYPAKVLEAFYGLAGALPTQLGNGFGLVITRTILELHNGQLELQNLPGGGACARLVLPKGR